MQIEDLLEMIACLRVFKLPNLHLDFGGTSILMLHTRSRCCRATLSPGITFTSVTSLRMVLQKRMKSICVAMFPSLYVMRWLSLFLKWSQEASRMLGQTLGFSHPQHLVPAFHIPSHHALPCIQCMHGLHGHSNLHEIRHSDGKINKL